LNFIQYERVKKKKKRKRKRKIQKEKKKKFLQQTFVLVLCLDFSSIFLQIFFFQQEILKGLEEVLFLFIDLQI